MLSGFFEEIISLEEAGIVSEPLENGETFEDNALIKALAVIKEAENIQLNGYAVLADDSGLCVRALNGLPGVHSARFANLCTESPIVANSENAANRKKLLELLVDEKDRTAYFVCALVLLFNGQRITANGKCFGKILYNETGSGGFGYDNIFLSDDLDKSFGTASSEEKNAVSHRSRALSALTEKLKEAGFPDF